MKRIILFTVCLTLLATLSACALFSSHSDSESSHLGSSTDAPSQNSAAIVSPSAEESVTEPLTTSEVESISPTDIQIPNIENALVPLYDTTIVIYNETGTYEHCCYRVPQLNCNTPDAERINADIAASFDPIVQDALILAEKGCTSNCYYIDYRTIWFENTLALLIYWEYPNQCIFYKVYNFDRVTGCEVTNAELLARVGLDEEAFISLAKTRSVEVFDEKYQNLPDDMKYSDFAGRQREASASDEFINPDMRMYLREDGKLMLISAIGSLAGAEYYEEVYPLVP